MKAPLVLLLLAPAALADVLDVRGPDADHDQIAAAVAAAVDGDVIRVWPRNYQGFTIDRSLFIVRATSSGTVKVQGTIQIRDLIASERVEMVGDAGQRLVREGGVSDTAFPSELDRMVGHPHHWKVTQM